jgi:hypothetical protein
MQNFTEIYCFLEEAEILNQANQAVVIAHAHPEELFSALFLLNQDEMLNQENFTVVAKHAKPLQLTSALLDLQRVGMLNEDNRMVLASHTFICDLVDTFFCLSQAGILNQDNFTVAATHVNPYGMGSTLSYLQNVGILNQENFTVVAAHVNPGELLGPLACLDDVGILNQENFTVFATHANSNQLATACIYLQTAWILNQANFDALIHPNHGQLLSNEALERVWGRLPLHLLTQVNFDQLLVAAQAENSLQELDNVINQMIVEVNGPLGHHQAQAFNDGQSTHTASVHRSVSKSAQKLMESYWGDFALDAKIQEIKAYVNGLETSFKNDAAKRCIVRITEPHYTFTDSSDVSILQLLALAYTAIHDETKCQCSLEDAKALFVEGLYEIQRGYNLNAEGLDDESPDDFSICSAGTFNKLIEKLNGIHVNVRVYFITHEGACSKFPKLVEEYALRYLKNIASPDTLEDYLQSKAIIDRMQQEKSIEPIWDKIKNNVIRDIWDEFKLAYGDNLKDRRFLDLINVECEYLEVPKELTEIEAQLIASVGHQHFISLQMKDLFNSSQSPLMARLHEHSLWVNRHSSPLAQNDFDKRYGLSIIPSK